MFRSRIGFLTLTGTILIVAALLMQRQVKYQLSLEALREKAALMPGTIIGYAEGEPMFRAGTFSLPDVFRTTCIKVDSPRYGKSAATTMLAQEPVIGLALHGDVRAYSTWYMNANELVHDEVGGTPVLVTW